MRASAFHPGTGFSGRTESLDDEDRTGRQLNNPVSATPDQPLIKCRVTRGANHQQVGTDLWHEIDNDPHRVTTQNVDLPLTARRRNQVPCTLYDRMKSARGGPSRLPDLLEKFRHRRNFLDAHEMQ